jgi:hypothetical protein
MRPTNTLLLVALAVAVALFFFLVEQPRHARENERGETERQLTSARAEDVGAVTIARSDLTIKAVRKGEHWQLTSPVVDSADDPALNVLVLTTCHAVVERRFDVEESDLPEYGLAPPSATVRLEASDGKGLLEIRIGDLNPSESNCYAVAGNPHEVLLLPSGVRRYAVRSLFEFRNKRITDIEVSAVTRIELDSPAREMTWRLGGAREWFSVQRGDTVPGDMKSIQNVVRELRGLRARDIPFGDTPETGRLFAEPAGTIRLWTQGDSAAVSLAFSKARGDSCYVEPTGIHRVALVDTTILAVFRRTADDFRDKRILKYPKDSLAKIVWESPAQTLTILKTGDSWNYANPGFGEIDKEAMVRLLSAMETLEFARVLEENFAETTGHGFETPFFRLTLFDRGDRVIDQITVGSPTPDGSSRYVSSRSTRVLASITSASISKVQSDFGSLGGP